MSRSLVLLVLLSSLNYIRANDEQLTRMEQKLTTDREFYDQWIQLISLQKDQLSEQEYSTPLDYVISSLSTCSDVHVQSAHDVNAVQPKDIEIMAEIGHLSSFCPSNYTLLKSGILGSCHQKSSTMTLPSLRTMLESQKANLTQIETNQLDDPLVDQAISIVESIKEIPESEKKWKMIFIFASIQDGTASETGQTAVEVLAAIEKIGKLLPEKTIVVVLRTSGNGIWRDASQQSQACHVQLAQWKLHSKYNSDSVWDQVERIVQENYKMNNFAVEVLPLFKKPALANLPQGSDLSILGYDCAHFNERGLSLLHLAVWNALFTSNPNRLKEYRPDARQPICPDAKCPFIRTAVNSDMCIWQPEDNSLPSIASHIIVIGLLLLTLILAFLILLFVCHSKKIGNISKRPKAFGASFSSIKFIDEDV